jgi:hypothetical protein
MSYASSKVKIFKNEWSTHFSRSGSWWCVVVRNARGDVHDKVRCDDYRSAVTYWKAFNAIAKSA